MKFSISVLALLGAFLHAPGAGELLVPCRNSIKWFTIEFGTCLLSLYYYFVSTDAAGEVHQNKDMFHCMREGMMKGSLPLMENSLSLSVVTVEKSFNSCGQDQTVNPR